MSMYKMVDVSAETWNNAGVLKTYENDDVNKPLLLLLCNISGITKDWATRIFLV